MVQEPGSESASAAVALNGLEGILISENEITAWSFPLKQSNDRWLSALTATT